MDGPLLVFDLDGTLLDSAPDLLDALDTVLALHGFGLVEHADARPGIGHGARHLIEFGLARQGVAVEEAQLAQMHKDFLDHYEQHIADRTRPFPGIVDLLGRFATSGWSFAVCTNKPEALSKRVLAAVGLTEAFKVVCGGDTFPVRKPHPDHLLKTIDAAGGAPGASLMVGDSGPDIEAARSAGVRVIGVAFGYSPVPMAELQPDLLIASYRDLAVEDAAALLSPRPASPDPTGGARLLDSDSAPHL